MLFLHWLWEETFAEEDQSMQYDVVIIGAGVSGAAIARELSRYQLAIAVVEKGSDVASGASKANSAIVHAGYDCDPGTFMARFNVQGNAMMASLCAELQVPYKPIGSMVLAFSPEDEVHLEKLYQQGIQNGVPDMSIQTGDWAREREPHLSPEVQSVLWAPSAAITCPYELTIALCENAAVNGVSILTDFEVRSLQRDKDAWQISAADGRKISASWVINAAGVYADCINALAGGAPFTICPRKGEYMLLDRKEGTVVSTVMFQPPTAMGKGVLVSPTVDGNVFAGPTALDMQDREDTSTTQSGMDALTRCARLSVPDLHLYNVITSFSGIRAVLKEKHDFLIERSGTVENFVNVAGICSPGLRSAPAIALYVRDLLRDGGLPLRERPDFSPHREHTKPFRHMNRKEKAEAIAHNPLYGRIICRCETVTEAEIVAAIHSPVPARSIDAIKRRTRAGMGRCQGGFCSPRVMEILARETGMDLQEVTKFGKGSWMVCGKIKEDGRNGEDQTHA